MNTTRQELVSLLRGAFCILDSYNDYFRDLEWIFPASAVPRPTVNRERNIIGSGQLHARKFFPEVLAHLATTPYEHLTDLGCGDGTFIQEALAVRPGLAVTAVDLSEYLLFHALSGQHLLSAREHSALLAQIPYRVVHRKDFDTVPDGPNAMPSSIVCILAPD